MMNISREYEISSPIIYSSVPIEKGISTLTLITTSKDGFSTSISSSSSTGEYAVNRISQKYPSAASAEATYQGLIYREHQQNRRRRLSSTGEGSGGDSSSTTASSSYYRGDGSEEGQAESDESSMKDEQINSDKEQNRKLRCQGEEENMDGTVTDAERQQVELFYKGLKTQIYVSGSLANLYTKSPSDNDWQLKYTGIPSVLLDVGEARSRDKRKIQIMLAERGTCFMLWRDTIDNLSEYKISGKAFHTMFYSEDHTLQIGLSFDQQSAASELYSYIEQLTSDPENISLSIPGKKKKKKSGGGSKKEKKSKTPLPPKSQISQPCCFQHVTNVEHSDRQRYYSLKEFVPLMAFVQNTNKQINADDEN